MKESQVSRKSKVLSQYVREFEGEKLLCVPCNTIIKHTLLWEDHEMNEKHQQNIQIYLQETERSSKKQKTNEYVKENTINSPCDVPNELFDQKRKSHIWIMSSQTSWRKLRHYQLWQRI